MWLVKAEGGTYLHLDATPLHHYMDISEYYEMPTTKE